MIIFSFALFEQDLIFGYKMCSFELNVVFLDTFSFYCRKSFVHVASIRSDVNTLPNGIKILQETTLNRSKFNPKMLQNRSQNCYKTASKTHTARAGIASNLSQTRNKNVPKPTGMLGISSICFYAQDIFLVSNW